MDRIEVKELVKLAREDRDGKQACLERRYLFNASSLVHALKLGQQGPSRPYPPQRATFMLRSAARPPGRRLSAEKADECADQAFAQQPYPR